MKKSEDGNNKVCDAYAGSVFCRMCFGMKCKLYECVDLTMWGGGGGRHSLRRTGYQKKNHSILGKGI
jgi:hypothetical protein